MSLARQLLTHTAVGLVGVAAAVAVLFYLAPAPLPADSVIIGGCKASTRAALGEDGTEFGAMECENGIVILAPVGRRQPRHEVPSVERPSA